MHHHLGRAVICGLILGGLALVEIPFVNAQEPPAEPAPAAIDPARLQDPAELRRLCNLVRQRNREIDQRKMGQVHTEVSINLEFDKQGQTTVRERKTERIRFEGIQEYRLVQKLEDMLTGRDRTPSKLKEVKAPKFEGFFPLGNEPENYYTYAFGGVENIDNRSTLRIAFEPTEPLENKFRGNVWVDPQSFEPVRFFGAWAQPPRFVYEMTMQLDWGPSENGLTQLRRSVVAGSGGLGLFQKRFRIETDLGEYRPAAGQ